MTTRRNDIQLAVIRDANAERDSRAEGYETGFSHQHARGFSHQPPFWRSLDELAGTPEFEEYLHREFPDNASEWTDPVGRRQFLKLMAASFSLAGLAGCTRQPTEKIVPYVRPAEQIVAGKPLYYATAMPVGGVGRPVLAKSHMGRPIKIEGNDQHPASLGGSDVLAQASILSLYDPDRSRTVINLGQVSTWADFLAALNLELEAQRGLTPRGAGLRLLTPPVTSPTLAAQIQTLLTAFPGAKWHQYDAAGSDYALAGAKLAFGEPVQTVYHLDKADVIVALDADFLCSGPGAVRYARDFAARRRVYEHNGRMNRLYAVESTYSPTGAAADHRLRISPQDMEEFVRALARTVCAPVMSAVDERQERREGSNPSPLPNEQWHTDRSDPSAKRVSQWIAAVARDLQAHRGAGLIIPGDGQPPAVHALAHAMNETLGNVGQTVTYIQPLPIVPVDGTAALADLAQDIAAGAVNLLVIVGCNPVYDAPADLRLAELLADVKSKVRFRVHLGLYHDETAEYCHWHIPAAHYLESWGDIRAYDGTVSILQPLIQPLYGGKSELELVAAMLAVTDRSAYDLVRDYWKAGKMPTARDFESAWQTALHDGFIAGTTAEPRPVKLRAEFARELPAAAPPPTGLSLIFRPAPAVRDGQFANNAWLQELPDALTKLTWDNAALLSPATARRLGLANEDLVELKYRGRSVTAPVWIAPGQADDCVVVNLGYGRRRTGRVGTGVGFNAYTLRTAAAPWFDSGLEIVKTGRSYRLACTQQHHSLEGRAIVREANLDEYRKHPDFAQHQVEKPAPDMTLYPPPNPKAARHAWGMAIDLNSCVGCNACVVACQAENNIPVVGKEQVLTRREMHWLRLDRYFQGEKPEEPRTYLQPMACTHCEYAPCEVVCPVGATVHSSEGLNEMVYNRCVGTRYCSNNCPYKVRRFNFLQYNDLQTPILKLLRNPDVTVRTRGVMEKCTYCVQRINAARIEAEKQNRPLRDGEIVTACQGACPTQAIVFGDLNDPESRVSRRKREPLNYGVLEELNTRPRTSHLAKVWNPNPELVE